MLIYFWHWQITVFVTLYLENSGPEPRASITHLHHQPESENVV